jgi:hypothetical protein
MADGSWRVPSLVQELAATVQEPPSRYLIPEQDRRDGQELAGVLEMPEPVPTIDLHQLLASDESADDDQEAAKLRTALLSWGFFLVRLYIPHFRFFSFSAFVKKNLLLLYGWSSLCPGY